MPELGIIIPTLGPAKSLARALGLSTVAEGIEDDEQRRAVLALGCDVGQGFLFARPMPVDDLTRLLAGLSTDEFCPIRGLYLRGHIRCPHQSPLWSMGR